MQTGGRVDQSEVNYVPLRLARIYMLMDECMEVVKPIYDGDASEDDVTEGEQLLLEEKMEVLNHHIEKVVKKVNSWKRTTRRTGVAGHRRLIELVDIVYKAYRPLYETLYEGFSLHDLSSGIKEPALHFYDVVRRVANSNSIMSVTNLEEI